MTVEDINAYSSIGTLIGIVLVGIFTKLDSRKANRERKSIHILVNGNMAIQLRTVMLQAKRIFALTKSSDDEQRAEDAEQAYNIHMMKQAIAELPKVSLNEDVE